MRGSRIAETKRPNPGVLETVSYMAWADGRIANDELSAARGILVALGLADQSSRKGPLFGRGPTPPPTIPAEGIDSRQRERMYASALLIAMADGRIKPEERRALRVLQHALSLSTKRCDEIEDVVFLRAGYGDWDQRFADILEALDRLHEPSF